MNLSIELMNDNSNNPFAIEQYVLEHYPIAETIRILVGTYIRCNPHLVWERRPKVYAIAKQAKTKRAALEIVRKEIDKEVQMAIIHAVRELNRRDIDKQIYDMQERRIAKKAEIANRWHSEDDEEIEEDRDDELVWRWNMGLL